MKHKNTLAILISTVLLVGFAPTAFAATQPPEPAPLERATVNLYCRIKQGGKTYSTTGSGVFVHQSGIILTNAHVGQYFLFASTTKRAKVDCSVRGGSPAKASYTAQLFYLSPNWARATVEATEKKQPRRGTGEHDFALLRVTGVAAKKGALPATFPTLPLYLGAAALQDGEEVVAAGYPAEKLKFKDIQRKLSYRSASTTVGAVQSLLRPHPDMLSLAGSSLSATGVSGGPVARASGELAGIAVAVSEGSSPEKRTLRAITLSYINRALLSESGYALTDYLQGTAPASDFAVQPYADLRASIEKTLRNTR